MNNIKVTYGGTPVHVESFTFNGGEESVKLLPNNHIFDRQNLVVEAHITSSSDLIRLLLVKDTADRMCKPKHTTLHLPYIPYARQDRVCDYGEALSIKVMCQLINSMNFDSVVVVDPHSDVAPALLNNVHIKESWEVWAGVDHKAVLVIPDAGAAKKSLKVAKHWGFTEVVEASKQRDVQTGAITNTVVHATQEDLEGKRCVIFDDIIDNGGTFIALAQELKGKGAARVSLYITHAILPNGADHLFESGVDEIWTTDSVYEYYKHGVDDRVKVVNLTY